jgi:hypothetical protein
MLFTTKSLLGDSSEIILAFWCAGARLTDEFKSISKILSDLDTSRQMSATLRRERLDKVQRELEYLGTIVLTSGNHLLLICYAFFFCAPIPLWSAYKGLWDYIDYELYMMYRVCIIVWGIAGDASQFAETFSQDLAAIEVQQGTPSDAAAATLTHTPAQGDEPRQEILAKAKGADTETITDLSLGLRTAVLVFAVHWLMHHCKPEAELGAAGGTKPLSIIINTFPCRAISGEWCTHGGC